MADLMELYRQLKGQLSDEEEETEGAVPVGSMKEPSPYAGTLLDPSLTGSSDPYQFSQTPQVEEEEPKAEEPKKDEETINNDLLSLVQQLGGEQLNPEEFTEQGRRDTMDPIPGNITPEQANATLPGNIESLYEPANYVERLAAGETEPVGLQSEDPSLRTNEAFNVANQFADELGLPKSQELPNYVEELPKEEPAQPMIEDVAKEFVGKYLSKGKEATKAAKAKEDKLMGLAEHYANMMAGARGASSREALNNALLRAAMTIGSSIAGTKADYSGVDALEKQRRDYSKEVKEGIAMSQAAEKEEEAARMKDPNNDLSKLARAEFFKLTGNKLPENVSIFELQKAGMPLGNIIAMNQSMKKEQLKQAAALTKAEAKAAEGRKKMEAQDKKTMVALYDRLNGLRRGGIMKSLVEKENAVNEMRTKLEDALSGKTTLNEASAKDLSAVWSRALTGGVPAASLITETMPISAKSKIAKMTNFITGSPTVDFYTKANLKHMRDQLDILDKAIKENKGRIYAKSLTGYSNIYNKYPAEKELIEAMYGDMLHFDKAGMASTKSQFGQKQEKAESPSTGPHGYRVRQGDAIYVWDGSKYVEEK